mgnify:CR=1 FL=1
MSIKDYILNNFKNDNKESIKEAIVESINSKDEVTLPGMGVFMEIIWNNATDEMKNEMLTILENNLKKEAEVWQFEYLIILKHPL